MFVLTVYEVDEAGNENILFTSGEVSERSMRELNIGITRPGQPDLRAKVKKLPKVRITPEGKKCSRCREIKPVAEFYTAPAMLSGYSSWCRKCQNEFYKKQYRELHPIVIRKW